MTQNKNIKSSFDRHCAALFDLARAAHGRPPLTSDCRIIPEGSGEEIGIWYYVCKTARDLNQRVSQLNESPKQLPKPNHYHHHPTLAQQCPFKIEAFSNLVPKPNQIRKICQNASRNRVSLGDDFWYHLVPLGWLRLHFGRHLNPSKLQRVSQNAPGGPQNELEDCLEEQYGAKKHPKGVKSKLKVTKREPRERQRESKGSQKIAKASQSAPKGSQKCTKESG